MAPRKKNPNLKRSLKYFATCKHPDIISRIIAKSPDNVIKSIYDATLNAKHKPGSVVITCPSDIGTNIWLLLPSTWAVSNGESCNSRSSYSWDLSTWTPLEKTDASAKFLKQRSLSWKKQPSARHQTRSGTLCYIIFHALPDALRRGTCFWWNSLCNVSSYWFDAS